VTHEFADSPEDAAAASVQSLLLKDKRGAINMGALDDEIDDFRGARPPP
jgi:hypothetical protein